MPEIKAPKMKGPPPPPEIEPSLFAASRLSSFPSILQPHTSNPNQATTPNIPLSYSQPQLAAVPNPLSYSAYPTNSSLPQSTQSWSSSGIANQNTNVSSNAYYSNQNSAPVQQQPSFPTTSNYNSPHGAWSTGETNNQPPWNPVSASSGVSSLPTQPAPNQIMAPSSTPMMQSQQSPTISSVPPSSASWSSNSGVVPPVTSKSAIYGSTEGDRNYHKIWNKDPGSVANFETFRQGSS